LAFSTDGYVVQPLEFPGGDIGSLAVTGTANDLAMAGARPHHLSVGLILEEGLELALLRRLVASMAAAAQQCGLTIVTGDTKVVERGKGDGVFITTSGIGVVEAPAPIDPTAIRPGDQLLVSGDLGRHGVAILAARHGLALVPPVLSDCAPLWPQVQELLAAGVRIHCLRDLTRGGLASALQELADAARVELAIEEVRLPVAEPVARTCDLLGFEPLHLANEGCFVAVVPPQACAAARALLEPRGGAWIGSVRPAGGAGPRVLLRTALGTERLLVPLSGELLPRIC
jgi:hydrogenase expression/formation protein HypE